MSGKGWVGVRWECRGNPTDLERQQENFSGSACEDCRDPNRFGPDCRSGELARRASGQGQSYLSLLTVPSCLSLLGWWPWLPALKFLHMVVSEASSRKPLSTPLFLLSDSLWGLPFYCDPLSQLWTLKVIPTLSTCRGQEGDVPDCTLVRLWFHAPLYVPLSVQLCAWRVQPWATREWKLPVFCRIHRSSL